MTIVYGVNGSGKSGYVRLMKKVFYSKAPEDIVKNIHLESGHKPVLVKFVFKSEGSEIKLKYPENKEYPAFQQFAIFDNRSVLRYLDQKNEFEFRPAGLSFFSNFTDAIKKFAYYLEAETIQKSLAG